MIIACIVLSSLALLAAVTNIILFCVEKKRDEKRRTALLEYIRNECNGTLETAEEFAQEIAKGLTSKFEIEKEFFNVANSKSYELIQAAIKKNSEEIEKLKSGIIPDYEKAMKAANAVNEFNAGVTAILNFDPLEVARKQRQGGDKAVG